MPLAAFVLFLLWQVKLWKNIYGLIIKVQVVLAEQVQQRERDAAHTV